MAIRFKKHPIFNVSTLFLIVINLATIAIAVVQEWEIGTVLFVYWGQIIAIGFFNLLRIRAVRKHVAKTKTSNSQEAEIADAIGSHVGSFFAMHYSIFVAMYLVFLAIFFQVNWKEGLLASLLFFLNHGISYLFNRENDVKNITSAARLIFYPYLRTIPMHMIISGAAITAWIGTPAVIVFLLLKTIVDVIMHVVEHSFTHLTFDS